MKSLDQEEYVMFGKKKSPVAVVLEAFTNKLNEENICYSTDAEKNVVRIKYNGEYFRSVTFTVIFDDDGESFSLRVFSIARFSSAQLDDAYEFCNRMNDKFRWLRFYIDDEKELTAALDAIISPSTAASVCTELLRRAVNIVDSVCKELN